MLEARRSRREEPVGGDLPDPVAHRGDDHDPEQQALAAEGVGLALLDPDVVLRADPAAVRTGSAAEVRGRPRWPAPSRGGPRRPGRPWSTV
jgi:hypothetical protein